MVDRFESWKRFFIARLLSPGTSDFNHMHGQSYVTKNVFPFLKLHSEDKGCLTAYASQSSPGWKGPLRLVPRYFPEVTERKHGVTNGFLLDLMWCATLCR